MAGRHGVVGHSANDQADAGHVELQGRGAGDRGDVRGVDNVRCGAAYRDWR